MSGIDELAACAGEWRGTNRLHDPNTGAPEDTPSTLTITPMLGGRFVRVEYTWSYRGEPQEGALIVGHEPESGRAPAYWIDSWHMGHVGMTCTGTAGLDGALDVRGTYAAPLGPDWGWRTMLGPGPDTLAVTMYNVTPDGAEEIAVEATYTRA